MTATLPQQWTRTLRRRRWSGRLLVVGALALAPSVVGTVLRLAPPSDDATALLASFIPYATVGYAAALLCGLAALLVAGPVRGRRWLLGVLAAVTGTALLLTCHLAWLAPLFRADDRRAGPDTFAVLSQNMKWGGADPDELTALAQRADVVVLAETTPEALAALAARGWAQRFPYAVDQQVPAVDTAVFSRFPLTDTGLVETELSGSGAAGRGRFGQRITTVLVPRVGEVRLMPVHPCNPYCGGNLWAAEHAALAQLAEANLDRPLVVAGDFNAVDDHGPMQDLRRAGLRSATDLAGAGWLPTYPAGGRLPPLLPIDHVLVDQQLTATAVQTVSLRGTDHRGLLVTLARAR